jgi:Ca2+-binding RTX toxin-like protein/Mg/Co/Ni transporter MgtE
MKTLLAGDQLMSRQRHTRQHLRHHRIEELERRQLMAGDVRVQFGHLWINGGQRSDVAEVSYDQTGSNLVVNLNGQSQSFVAAGIQNIVFNGGIGDDTFVNRTSLTSMAYGGDGNDSLSGGSGIDNLYGQAGDDVLAGNTGDDRLAGGIGNDKLYGGDGNDLVNAGDGDDYLAGGAGDDQLTGGAGNDGLHGGAGLDHLWGQVGQDRFLTQAGDKAYDVAPEDAQVRFTHSNSASWSDDQVEIVDEAFRILQNRTGNTHLLKDPVASVPITIQRVHSISDAGADNADPVQPEVIGHFWSKNEGVNNRTPHRIIRMPDNAFGTNDWAKQVVLHEIAHNWDSSKEIGRVLPGMGALWDIFENIHGQAKSALGSGTGANSFVSPHAQTDAYEDFADTFAQLLLNGRQSTDSLVVQRYNVLDCLFSSLSKKGEWDGHADDVPDAPSEWEKFSDWVDERRDAVLDFFRQLDPTQWKLALPHLDPQMLAAIIPALDPSQFAGILATLDSGEMNKVLPHLSTSQLAGTFAQLDASTLQRALGQLDVQRLADVFEHFDGTTLNSAINQLNADTLAIIFERLDGSTLATALDQLNARGIADILERVGGDTLESSLKRLSDDLVASVLEKVNGTTLEAALDRMSTSRIATVLERVDGDTLKASLKRLSDKRLANVLEKFDGSTLNAALDRMTTSRIADVLDRVDTATLKASLKRLSASDAKAVIGKLDKKVADVAKDYLKKADPAKYKDAFGSLKSKANPKNWF